ncbi:hypothetical protein GFO_1383 [Christiangramia forsetii KT0803]|uniref:Uncharacterized protein n=1 Tax=Christiangramia forsetii (strain DSM 17595 / CGMCC 1.15422 / KT0803) TaxID=411154 RepID=A0M162_CHRFK|nr:hypothetical protein GFO_1383 [Christiangramia forsetii KT0803]
MQFFNWLNKLLNWSKKGILSLNMKFPAPFSLRYEEAPSPTCRLVIGIPRQPTGLFKRFFLLPQARN